MQRRTFLTLVGAAAATAITPIGRAGWAAAVPGAESPRRLVVIFLRGAVDGLNVVIPYGDRQYFDARPTIAVSRRGGPNGLQDLNGYFGLHPALAPLLPLWKQGGLAFVQACGSSDATRSHFDAQDYMESGTPGVKSTADGWMNRVLATLPEPHGPTEAISLGPTLPRILSGPMRVANIPLGRAASNPMALDRPAVATAFDKLYAGGDPMSRAFQQGQSARKKLLSELQEDMQEADNGAPQPNGFPDDAARLARLIGQDPSIRLAFLALGGWDTHVNQGADDGQLANHLRPLGEGLASFVRTLGPAYRDTVILVVSEFGRTMHENGNGGTDHGHGNVMWALGGPIRGGKVYGDWPGLDGDALYQGRDLAITTDFRTPIAAVLQRHLGLSDQQMARVFPEMPRAKKDLGVMLKA
jgi:uncharacterized protein (DUF1501 family)